MLEGANAAKYGDNAQRLAASLVKAFFKYWWPTPIGSIQRAKIDFVVKQGPLEGKAVVIVGTTRINPGRKLHATSGPADTMSRASFRKMLAEDVATDLSGNPTTPASVAPFLLHASTSGLGPIDEPAAEIGPIDDPAAGAEGDIEVATLFPKPTPAAQCANTFPLITPSIGGSTVFVYHGTAVGQFRQLVLTPFFDAIDNWSGGARLPGSTQLRNQFTAAAFLAEVNDIGTAHLTTTLDVLSPANALNVFTANYQVRY